MLEHDVDERVHDAYGFVGDFHVRVDLVQHLADVDSIVFCSRVSITGRFFHQFSDDPLNLIKPGLFKQFFSKCFVIWAEELTVTQVVKNVPSQKTNKHTF